MKRYLRSTGVMVLAVTLAMVLASLTLAELTRDLTFIWLGMAVIALLMLISGVSRRLAIHPGLIHLWQALALLGSVIGLGASLDPGEGNPLHQVMGLLRDGAVHIQTTAAPMEPNPGATLILVILIGLVTIVADVLVLSLATPAWAIAPLLTLYLIPALAMKSPAHWWSYLLVALAYLGVLAADSMRDLTHWTRSLAGDDAPREASTVGLWSMATLVSVPVLVLSLIAGNALPTFGSLDLQSKRPRGVGPIQMQDPTVQLHRNLAQQSDRVLVTYTTENPEGEYLRLASLTVMGRDSWKLTPVQLRDGDLTPPPGATGNEKQVTTRVTVGDFGSQYLPAPYAPVSFEAEGPWAFDPVSLMILSTATSNTDATRELSYSVTSTVVDPDAATFSTARAGRPPDAAETAKVPDGVPQDIIKLTADITKDAQTPVLKAAAIQAWLRDPRRFTYSTQAPPGDGFDVMSNFLLRSRSGYCVHFASAMALMARISGIPSRVSVGFLPGTKRGDRWEVRGREMHAWPELYFEGHGWVRFEPTAGVADAPSWTVVRANNEPSTSPGSQPSASTSATPSPSSSVTNPSSSATQTQFESPGAGDIGPAGDAFPFRQLLMGLGITLAVIALMLLPMLLRGLVRRRRFGGERSPADQVEALWAEVRDTLVDVGVRWPDGAPRQKAAALAPAMGQTSREALVRIAHTVEQSRYSRGLDALPEEFAGDVRYVIDDVRTRQTTGTKLRARLLPTSLFVNAWQRLVRR